ncbi:beta-lactamase family protein [Roseomonas aerophila]|uniref:Beta-lactamase family protein n=1 Tax=Teichococcus aerophilus TaxID=1224513 RepID=A0ABR7RRX7_9PROT|nr:serine hydrolase domain-containing protein [Pseudoroseomonas aerophila]MBC9208976.1 beta-lactamase family protein [Pseudoroseomonas aerophila]
MTDREQGKTTLSNWRTWPFNRWGFQNADRLIPTAIISGQPAPPRAMAGLELLDLPFAYPDGRQVTLGGHLGLSAADALLVLQDGEVLTEWYAPWVDPSRPHTVFSISKSITGLLAGIAVGQGLLDPEAQIADFLPMAPGAAYAGAHIRELLDMTVGIAFEDDYLDTAGLFGRYRRAMLWNPPDANLPAETLPDVLADLQQRGAHGERFFYASPNVDMLGLVLERVTGQRYHTYLAEQLWAPMGASGPAYITTDGIGTARASGGLCMTARDLARIGQLLLADGRGEDGQQVVPAAWIEDLREQASFPAWAAGSAADMFPRGRYRSGWYHPDGSGTSFCAIGIHAQWLWVDRTKRRVVVKLSSRPEPSEDAATQREIAMMNAIFAAPLA